MPGRDLLWLVIYGCSVAGLVLFGVCAALMIGFAVLIGVGEDHNIHIVEPSPDRSVSLVRSIDLGGGATSPAFIDIWLVGARFERRVYLGRFTRGGWTAGDGWQSDAVVNVCMLRYRYADEDKPQPPQAVALTNSHGRRVLIEVPQDCPSEIIRENEGPFT